MAPKVTRSRPKTYEDIRPELQGMCSECKHSRQHIVEHEFRHWCDLHKKYEMSFHHISRSWKLKKEDCEDFKQKSEKKKSESTKTEFDTVHTSEDE